MPRLIDAEKLRAEYLGMPNCYNGFSDSYDKAMIVDMVDEQPTIDAVQIVRCKDCRWRTGLEMDTAWHPCDEVAVNDMWFCAYGERRRQ